MLEDANIKLSGVLSNVFGVSGKLILARILKGETDPALLCELSKGKLKGKKAEIQKALIGGMREHHKFMITTSAFWA